MHRSIRMTRGMLASLLLLSSASITANSAGTASSLSGSVAATKPSYFSTLAEWPEKIKRIKVVVGAPLPMHDPASYDEAAIAVYGCTFSTNDPVQVATILHILRDENAQMAKRRGYLLTDFYGAVYIDEVKGGQEKIFYDYHGITRVDAVINGHEAQVNASIAKDLARWASEFSGKEECRPPTGRPFPLKQFD